MDNLKCIAPDEIQDGDLTAYLHGDAPRRVCEHVARCAFCADQVERLRSVDVRLLATFYRDACPSPDTLADFILGRLPTADKLRVAAHVRQCELCSREVAATQDVLAEPPPTLLEHLKALLSQAVVVRPAAHVSAPVRGGGWKARFEASGWLITLAVHGNGLTGRVRARETASPVDFTGQAWLLSKTGADDDIPHSRVDERGRFRFEGLAAGAYTLLLQIGDRYVSVEGTIDISGQRDITTPLAHHRE